MSQADSVSAWRLGVVAETRPLTKSARSIMLDVPGWGGNIGGQHADVRLTAEDGYQAVRSYSVASVGAGDRIELAVDRLPDGEVSPYLVDDLLVGDEVEVRGPLGGWFVWRPDQIDPVQLVAGGSGIVPLMAMIRSHRAAGSAAPFRLLYSLRTPEDAFFQHELLDPPLGVEVTWHYTRQAPREWGRTPGRLTPSDLGTYTFAPTESPAVYVCGPTGFVETVARALVELGHSPQRVKTERFGGT